MNFNEQMKNDALTKIVVFWKKPHPEHGKSFRSFSLDGPKNRRENNPWPAINRYVAAIARNEAGNYNCILVYDKTTDQLILKIDQNGQWHY